MKNTKISYLYRDASNYKAFREEVLAGTLTKAKVDKIKSRLIDGEYFVPSRVGLDDLQGELQGYDFQDYNDDHFMHELNEIESTTDKPTFGLSAKEFFKMFSKADFIFGTDEPIGHILTGDEKFNTVTK